MMRHQACVPVVWNHIGGVMVSMLASSAVYRGFEPRSVQTRDYKIGMCYLSPMHAALMRKSKDGLARNRELVGQHVYRGTVVSVS